MTVDYEIAGNYVDEAYEMFPDIGHEEAVARGLMTFLSEWGGYEIEGDDMNTFMDTVAGMMNHTRESND